MKQSILTRRAFLAAATTTMAGSAFAENKPNTAKVVPRKVSPNEKLNVAAIGAGGKGREDIFNLRRENVVALCDPDEERAGEAFAYFEQAKKFKDYRKMLDSMDEIDAVTVTTPDHTHAPAAYTAMKLGKHVYVQKPLTHTVAEAMLLQKTAKEMGVATQMGNQGHSGNGARQVCEMIWSGAIGEVREAHVWTNRPSWKQAIDAPLPTMEKPATLDWDLWLGTAADRDYSKGYCPFNWRGWYDFGAGALGDMACHIMDPVFWSLKLAEADGFSVELVKNEGKNDHTFPKSELIKFQFPARGQMAPVDVYWYDGGNLPPRPAGVPDIQKVGDGEWNNRTNGSYFVGESGIITAGEYGGKARLLPDERMADFKMPAQTIPRIEANNHYGNWTDACKGGAPACSNFDYSGPFTVMVLMGCVALRSGQRVEWSNKTHSITNMANGAELITKPYRKGWELPV
ncbi:MAG: Gfo/Idh/MocA family oxidoreductase [Candidatus Hydrogenedentota bacterium]